ncbi:hypothetical protein FG386_002145 [Cryptosporidium ryanae]|uniref:uncharacterized protein n=1 Tax=Cryptosporidium ryanae TaxID=515981 RepID=UPI00351A43C9|nr:hypothetical protein FG386_002145 [Cryptosporidium ryanae]
MRTTRFYGECKKLLTLILVVSCLCISELLCLVEKIDSKTLSGTNAYIWLIKSPNILSQNINDPTRYSYGLIPESTIKVDLKFDYWDYIDNENVFISKEINNSENDTKNKIEYNFERIKRGKKTKNDNFYFKNNKNSVFLSGIPLIRFEDFPVSCILVFRADEIIKLVGNIELINSSEFLYYGTKLNELKIYNTFSKFIRYGLLQWRSIINHFMPKIVTKSIEKRCFESLSDMVIPDLNLSNDFEKTSTNNRVSLISYSKKANNYLTSNNKHNKNIFLERNFYIKSKSNNEISSTPGKTVRNVFLLLLNSEQLAALNHSTMQDLTLISISNNYSAHFNVNSYIRSMIRIPVQDGKLQFEYKVPYLDRYSLLVVNGDRVPLLIRGNITVNNPEPLNHLPFERRMDKQIVRFMFTLYVLTTVVYIVMIINDQDGNLKITNLQLISLLLLILKPICLYFDNKNLELFIQYGQIKFTNWFIPRAISRIHETIFIIYLLLISLGWKILRDNLLAIETRLIFGLFVILFYIGLFEVLFGIFQIARYIFNAIVSLCIIVSTNINSTLIQNTISDNSISPRLGILYKKWQSYSIFKWIFTLFIIKPTLLFFWRVFNLQSNGYDDWIYSFLDQFLDFVIIVSVIVIFRPFKIPKLFTQLHPKTQFENNNRNFDERDINDNYYLFNNNTNHYIDNINVSMWPVVI